MPFTPWTGDLVLYAHGYTAPHSALTIPSEADLFAGVFGLSGRAFAVTSFRSNGLVVQDGIQDLQELLELFIAEHGAPGRVYLIGASQGALIATLALERRPEFYDGALALCGPLGSFEAQVDTFTDFRVVFDYFLPGLLPPSATEVPDTLIEDWSEVYGTSIRPLVLDPAQAATLDQLFGVTGAAFDVAAPETRENTVSGLLWYNVNASQDAATRLGGQPYDNADRRYQGSVDDTALNAGVVRFVADPLARAQLQSLYETTGLLERPLVTLHTTGDEIVPYSQSTRYAEKVAAQHRTPFLDPITVDRYGHCEFEPLEILGAFDRLVRLVDATD
jgi:pimeloyl-ACP methyl ester carboxylesterase